MKNQIIEEIEKNVEDAYNIADLIFDNPELCYEEFFSSNILEDYLEKHGFSVNRGLGDIKTAFKAEYKNKDSSYNIGLLCEYDALPMGHACGHHIQGPAICLAAIAIKNVLKDFGYNLIIYGTPAEEGGGGKIKMLEQGFLKELDVAIMMHAGSSTQVDIKSMALSSQKVIFKGKSSHAALKPENGRSALDALLLSFNAIEFLREHVKEDTKMHYTIGESLAPSNVVPDRAVGIFSLRSYNSKYLDSLIERFKNIIKGAALMTQVQYEIEETKRLESKLPSYKLNELMIENAKQINALRITAPREKTGSTDFGNVTYILPGACIRVAFVDDGVASHSQEFLDLGKSNMARYCLKTGAQIVAMTVFDLINEPNLIETIKDEFNAYKSNL